MLPSFDLQGGLPVAAARGLLVAATLSAFGTVVFRTAVLPKAAARMAPDEVAAIERRMLILAQASAAAALCGAGLWLVMQAAFMADVTAPAALLAVIPKVLLKTAFGHVIALQAAALLLLGLALAVNRTPGAKPAALVTATIALMLQAGHSHAFSMYDGPSLLLGCDLLHLLGAGAWLGGLIPLLICVRMASPVGGAMAARWFSPLGQGCVAALALSALWQSWVLVATIPGLVGTAYGWMILVKLALSGVLLGFAYFNRYRFAPALLGGAPGKAKRILLRSITWQTGSALAILAAAAVLSELPPAMHIQALWPFPQRPSLTTINEDPDFRWEVIEAGLALAGAAGLLAVALFLRRFRIAAAATACVIAWFALPHLDLLLVPAYPTSFYRSPTGFSAASIAGGQALFAQNCTACHGAGGHADGPLAKSLPEPPADLTAAHLWMHSDGELFWWISHGIPTPEGGQAMPGFASSLDDESRWNLIDYIRAHNAGLTLGKDGHWGRIIPAPAFTATCENGQTRQSADFQGAPLLLAIGAAPAGPSPQGGIERVVADGNLAPGPGLCTAADLQIGRAYAIAAGLAGNADGWRFLIDSAGLLRRAWPPGQSPGAGGLIAAIADMRSHKVQTAMQAASGMQMPPMDTAQMQMPKMQMPQAPMSGMPMSGMPMSQMQMPKTQMPQMQMPQTQMPATQIPAPPKSPVPAPAAAAKNPPGAKTTRNKMDDTAMGAMKM